SEHRVKMMGANPIDPLAERRKAIGAMVADAVQTFGAAFESWIIVKREKLTNASYADQLARQVTAYCKPIWKTPITDIDTPVIGSLLEPHWNKHRVPASRIRGHIEGIIEHGAFKWGLDLPSNPARWDGHLEHRFAAQKSEDVEHIETMPIDDVPAF